MAYLMWRVLTKRHSSIVLSFLIVGHTKFSPDTCFGLIKRLYSRTNVGCLRDIATVVTRSSIVNEPELVGAQDGSTFAPTYDWASYFDASTTTIKGIKKYQHFSFRADKPGKVFTKCKHDDVEQQHTLIKKECNDRLINSFPSVISPPGLSAERQQYLYEKIREFCPEEVLSLPIILNISRKIKGAKN